MIAKELFLNKFPCGLLSINVCFIYLCYIPINLVEEFSREKGQCSVTTGSHNDIFLLLFPLLKLYSRLFSIIHVLLLFSNRSGIFERPCLIYLFLIEPLNIILLGIHTVNIHIWLIIIIDLNSLTFLVPACMWTSCKIKTLNCKS